MNLDELPSRPLSLTDIDQLQESLFCSPLFFLPNEETREDIVVIATTQDSIHSHIAFDPEIETWCEVGTVEITDSLGESNLLAFNLFGDISEWLQDRYSADEIAMIENPPQ